MRFPLPRRSVHLDFHTGPQIPDVGADFDPDEFAATFVRSHVDSVTVFAKCHHGQLYYDTARPERHPGLVPGLDLLAGQVEALHRVGILAPIYVSVQVDEYAARHHPEWLAIDADGRQVKLSPHRFAAGWHVLDMASPFQDYVADQLHDVLRHLGRVDGMFLDMCWDQDSTSTWALDAMRRAGLDPREATDRARHARSVAHTYMRRYRDLLLPFLSERAAMSVWFNSRPKTALPAELAFIDHVEIEALPTGGWGYSYLPYVARFVRPLGLPTLAHTGRFHKSWGDNGGLKPAAALKYECCQMLLHGLQAGIGDLLHPRGVLSPRTYKLIGGAYEYLRRCEPFVRDAEPAIEAAVIMDPELGDAPGPVGVGVVRALQQLRIQFEVVAPHTELAAYPLIVVPETTRIDANLARQLSAALADGQAVLVSGAAAMGPDGAPALDELGLAAVREAPYSHTFIRTGTGTTDSFDHVMYEPSLQLTARPDADVMYQMAVGYFERTWDQFSGHDYTPVRGLSEYAAVVRCGRAVTVGAPIFTAFGRHALEAYRDILADCFAHLRPQPLLEVGGPRHLETSVVDTETARVVHLVSYLASRQAEGVSVLTHQLEGIDLVHDPFPLIRVPVRVRAPRRPTEVTLQPHGITLPFDYSDGYVTTSVDIPDGHGMIVLSWLAGASTVD